MHPSATALSDGRVLIAGGVPTPGLATNNAWIFDTESLRVTEVIGMLGGRRAAHTAVPVRVGAAQKEGVWLFGGTSEVSEGLTSTVAPLDTTIVFDPDVGEFVAGPSLGTPRAWPSVAQYGDRLLVTGGYTTASLTSRGTGAGTTAASDLFRLDTGADFVESTAATAGRAGAVSFANVDDSAVLVAGGYSTSAPGDGANCTDASGGSRLVDCADLFDPAAGTNGQFSATAVADVPYAHATGTELTPADATGITVDPVATVVAGGVVGVDGTGEVLGSGVQLYANGQFYPAPGLQLDTPRGRHEAVALKDGTVMWLGGGRRNDTGLYTDVDASTLRYDSIGLDPAGGSYGELFCDNQTTDIVLPDCATLFSPRVGHGASRIQASSWLDGAVLVAGGAQGDFVASGGPAGTDPAVEILVPAYRCVEVLVDPDNSVYENQPPPAVGGGHTGRCELDRRFSDDRDIYRNGEQ
jgi:hypothetical protein